MSRYSFAEAMRAESHLGNEKPAVIALIFQRVTNVEPISVSNSSYEFKIPVREYLKRATSFHTPAWKLVNNNMLTSGARWKVYRCK